MEEGRRGRHGRRGREEGEGSAGKGSSSAPWQPPRRPRPPRRRARPHRPLAPAAAAQALVRRVEGGALAGEGAVERRKEAPATALPARRLPVRRGRTAPSCPLHCVAPPRADRPAVAARRWRKQEARRPPRRLLRRPRQAHTHRPTTPPRLRRRAPTTLRRPVVPLRPTRGRTCRSAVAGEGGGGGAPVRERECGREEDDGDCAGGR